MDAAEEALTVTRVRAWLHSGRAREVRQRAGLSQLDVAGVVGTSAPQVSRWESGKVVPYRDSALRLAGLYEKLEEIMTAPESAGGGDPPRPSMAGRP